ncbi:immediate early gene 2 [Choristoneura fumiferana multiple nucleopolyhedrovirus]|uniref:E3 ubiquitin-protein ligase IE2 n=1 Tax=Choristoneura fumiferana nuclear polyhedrosis virus TaxID=208973 RepID=VIE2_NPVCF|nr:immediate early gene 2 [Choristoneura fumiferana multiple nucleopolyhedrovirus]Q8QME4.1 RecName: Full=E3 ubiquitin-protein ligase IE2; AltName: Full=Immediate-early protein IE2; AltName: Full=RING-type E3 ubiquitin transferase IE2 [Choristoneura fumiferana multiple nucleopolyhedrovirus]AAA67992.1 immediate early gene 2 [Choristoneura fumiferana multiple nucleopolyhedrovirus]
MSRQINANTPVSRRRSGLRGRRLSYSPEDAVPTPAPRFSILEARRAADRPAEERMRAWHVIGDTSEPVTLRFVHNNAQYTVHGNAPFNTADFQEERDSQETEAANRAHQRAVHLHEHLHEVQETAAPLPNYSPVHSPDLTVMEDLETPRQRFETMFHAVDAESEDEAVPLPQVDMAVFCHICSCFFTDIKNYNSSFVTTSECNHAVCFKCYTSIMFDKELFKCSMCNRATPTCRVYNHKGFVELLPTRAVRDKQAIKTHWAQLLDNNMSDSKVPEQNDVQKLQAELAELRAEMASMRAEMASKQLGATMALENRRGSSSSGASSSSTSTSSSSSSSWLWECLLNTRNY